MIPRVYDNLESLLNPGKVIVLYGPRRVGKTTLLGNFLGKTGLRYKLDNGDNIETRDVFSSQSLERIKRYAEGYQLIAIDEAQRIPDVGFGLKILVDSHPEIKVIITGSASLDLSYKVGEPLVGRKFTYNLYPVSQKELLYGFNKYELSQRKDEYLIFGAYPEVLQAEKIALKTKILTEIASSYLLKDIFELEDIRNTKAVLQLLKLIAFQVGSEVSLNELSRSLEIDKKTVSRYLYFFEKAFIIFEVGAYSRNLRKEVIKKSKYYFYDNGIRNALIKNFNDLSTRNDTGELWENFIAVERIKKQEYSGIYASNYFWRTWDKREIDWVEMREGKLFGYEFKWSTKKIPHAPKDWITTYENATYEVITPDNYLDFIA